MSWSIDDKIAFLKQPESYPCRPSAVEAVETHMACVFLTDRHAYKLKKPVRHDYLDFSTINARRLDCDREIRLNRRLAPDVYLAVVPLTGDSLGAMHVDRPGEPIDWLVKMRKLPRRRMLDRAIQEGTADAEGIRAAAKRLADFYRDSPAVDIGEAEYRGRLKDDIRGNARELTLPSFGLPPECVRSVALAQARFIEDRAAHLDARVKAGHVIDAHGDLRPEHICLESPPVIIDCLEFNRDFRLLDTASELSFLELECERLGAPFVGELVWRTYVEETGDQVPDELRRFYRSYHALTRAKIAIWHLRDTDVRERDSWKPKAENYLALAAQALA